MFFYNRSFKIVELQNYRSGEINITRLKYIWEDERYTYKNILKKEE